MGNLCPEKRNLVSYDDEVLAHISNIKCLEFMNVKIFICVSDIV